MGGKDFFVAVLEQVTAFWTSFISSLLSWPVVALVVVLLLLRPLRKLIGRVKFYKGLGMDIEFREEMQGIESSADEAIDTLPEEKLNAIATSSAEADETKEEPGGQAESASHLTVAEDRPDRGLGTQHYRVDYSAEDAATLRSTLRHRDDPFSRAARDPSGAIIAAWERLLNVLVDVNAQTRGPGRPSRRPAVVIEQLARLEHTPPAFIDAVRGLQKVRNEVAHGDAVPSPGVARTYVWRAREMEQVAKTLAPTVSDTSVIG